MAKTTKKKNKISIFDVVNLIAMILVGLIMLMPILNLVAKAFSSEGNVIAGKVLFWPLEFQTSTIKYVLTTPEFGTSFLVTVTVTITGTIGAMLLTVMAAYPLSKPHLIGRKFFIFALIFSGMFSSFNLFLIKNYFETLPEVIEEAARIDGASNMRIFFSVVLPMSTPVLATVTLYYAVAYWSNYFAGVMYITDANLKPLQQYMFDLVTQATSLQDSSGNFGDVNQAMNVSGENIRAATIVVSTIPILCVYPFLQKYFVKGITIGSVKG